MGKPVIASVQRIAVANGIGRVAACDLAIAAEDAHECVHAFLGKREPVWKHK